jgi:uncharacterized protein YhaN
MKLEGQGDNAMSSTSIELFRQHTEQQRHEEQEPRKHKSQAQERTQETDKPSLVAEMSRIEHEVRQLFDCASPTERDNVIRFLELVIRNLKRLASNA